MKTSQLLMSVGAAAILGMLAFYLYLAQTPPYERTYQRGLDLNTARNMGNEPSEKAAAQGEHKGKSENDSSSK